MLLSEDIKNAFIIKGIENETLDWFDNNLTWDFTELNLLYNEIPDGFKKSIILNQNFDDNNWFTIDSKSYRKLQYVESYINSLMKILCEFQKENFYRKKYYEKINSMYKGITIEFSEYNPTLEQVLYNIKLKSEAHDSAICECDRCLKIRNKSYNKTKKL